MSEQNKNKNPSKSTPSSAGGEDPWEGMGPGSVYGTWLRKRNGGRAASTPNAGLKEEVRPGESVQGTGPKEKKTETPGTAEIFAGLSDRSKEIVRKALEEKRDEKQRQESPATPARSTR